MELSLSFWYTELNREEQGGVHGAVDGRRYSVIHDFDDQF